MAVRPSRSSSDAWASAGKQFAFRQHRRMLSGRAYFSPSHYVLHDRDGIENMRLVAMCNSLAPTSLFLARLQCCFCCAIIVEDIQEASQEISLVSDLEAMDDPLVHRLKAGGQVGRQECDDHGLR
eukprot:scpid67345/ scgid23099/ 